LKDDFFTPGAILSIDGLLRYCKDNIFLQNQCVEVFGLPQSILESIPDTGTVAIVCSRKGAGVTTLVLTNRRQVQRPRSLTMILQSSTARISAFQNGKELTGTRFGAYHNYTVPCDPGKVAIRFENLQDVAVDVNLEGQPAVTVPANGAHDFPFTVQDSANGSTSIHWPGPRAVGLFFTVDEAVDAVEVID
jgi:hypothetical protein